MTTPTPREVLAELVACKDLKDRAEALHFAGPNFEPQPDGGWEAEYKRLRADYIQRQPEAWQAARAALAVPAQPAASGVDALWVETAMHLAEVYGGEVANDYDPSEVRMDAAREALRAHLSTALAAVQPPLAWGITYRGELLPTTYRSEADAMKELRRRNTVYPDDENKRTLVALYATPRTQSAPPAPCESAAPPRRTGD